MVKKSQFSMVTASFHVILEKIAAKIADFDKLKRIIHSGYGTSLIYINYKIYFKTYRPISISANFTSDEIRNPLNPKNKIYCLITNSSSENIVISINCFAPVDVVSTIILNKINQIQSGFIKEDRAVSILNKYLGQNIDGLKIVKVFAQQGKHKDKNMGKDITVSVCEFNANKKYEKFAKKLDINIKSGKGERDRHIEKFPNVATIMLHDYEADDYIWIKLKEIIKSFYFHKTIIHK